MIPYRRQKAIDTGDVSLLAADLTVGDVILIRRADAIERTRETVAGIEYIPNTRMMRIHFHDAPAHETACDMRVGVERFTNETWRQHVPWEIAERARQAKGGA